MGAATRFRSRKPATAGAAALMLALATACSSGANGVAAGGANGGGGGTAAGAPRNGGTLRLAVEKEPECLDPHQSPTESARALTRPILDSLVHQDAQGNIHPWLATGWKVSPDRLTYTFELRQGVTFTDGERFDAQAVVANLDHVVAPETKSLLAGSLLAAYRSAKAVGPSTVEIRFKRPDSGFLTALALPNLGIQSPRTLKGSPSTLCAKIVGTGPFRSDTGFVPQKGIDYVRNPSYDWAPESAPHHGPARLDRIEVRVVPDNAARLGALTSGQVDAVTGLSPTSLNTVKNLPGFTPYSTPFPGINYSYWPNTANGPLSDVNVRKALRAGIDWGQIVKNVYFGVYKGAQGVLSASTPGYNGSLAQAYTHDPAGAARLLDQAGWTGRDAAGYRTKDGRRLTLRHMWSDGSVANLAAQVQSAAKQLGVELVEENLDGGTFVKRLLAGDYELIDTSFSAPGPDVLRVLFGADNIPTPERGISNNMARYDNPAVEAGFRRALGAEDQAEQHRAYAEVQKRITEDAAVLPVYSPLSTVTARDGVRGVGFNADGTPDLYGAWLAS
ncbi:peptide/nickel transport system substrate-binding protein [Streptosporangium subroseum]|uniref:Peptide/nickel transport system substrate-binding protein n=1 Tax=Streptosporangium subroseum TaxID=106412 RepID=A0A239CX71_9ACTN|nr:ABC transporter substrate-binding protein [Streptosporangium subroseum]SNS23953.1 peptide/nickel transport system substrate-binding protein [Streptosporangium subroseum]